MDRGATSAGSHLSAAEIAAYLDLVPSGAERARLEAHLAGCEPCLADLLAAAAVLGRAPTGAKRP